MTKSAMLVICCVVGCSTSSPSEPPTDCALSRQSVSSVPDAKSVAAGLVEAALPSWDVAVLANGAAPSRRGAAFDRPIELAQAVKGAPLSFLPAETDDNNILYRNADRTVTVRTDRYRGFWSMVASVPEIVGVTSFSLAHAAAATQKLFESFELPPEQAGAVVQTNVGVRSGDGSHRVVARHVRIHRKVNGYRVMGSHVMATFGLDGTPFRVVLSWPDFKPAPVGKLRSREQAASDLTELVATRLVGGQYLTDLHAELSYQAHTSDRILVPTLRLSFVDPSRPHEPELIEYSLAAGSESATP